MDIFDVIGPVMIGPSSSHTAGAVRMGNLALNLLEEQVADASVYLHGSFAKTAKGHGTDRAIVGGLLGFLPDDERISRSFEEASRAGLFYRFIETDLGEVHPNSAQIIVKGKTGKTMNMQLSSVGGGKIVLNEVDGVNVRYEGKYPTVIVFNDNVPGVVVSVSRIIAEAGINIVEMRVYSSYGSGKAVMVINMNTQLKEQYLEKCRNIAEIKKVIYLDRLY